MGETVTYPNGQVLTSTALTVQQISALLQTLTYGVLGLAAGGVNYTDGQVRVGWPLEGQPFEDSTQDVCYVSCVPKDSPYSRVRDRELTQNADGSLTETWTYTRAWSVRWVLYGPNSADRARAIWSSMFMDYATDQLGLSNLFPVPDFAEPVRAPENFNAQWWDRSDFEAELYEAVTETIGDGKATSVEVKINTKDGQVADLTITAA